MTNPIAFSAPKLLMLNALFVTMLICVRRPALAHVHVLAESGARFIVVIERGVELLVEILLSVEGADLAGEADVARRRWRPIDGFDAYRVVALGDGNRVSAVDKAQLRRQEEESTIRRIERQVNSAGVTAGDEAIAALFDGIHAAARERLIENAMANLAGDDSKELLEGDVAAGQCCRARRGCALRRDCTSSTRCRQYAGFVVRPQLPDRWYR